MESTSLNFTSPSPQEHEKPWKIFRKGSRSSPTTPSNNSSSGSSESSSPTIPSPKESPRGFPGKPTGLMHSLKAKSSSSEVPRSPKEVLAGSSKNSIFKRRSRARILSLPASIPSAASRPLSPRQEFQIKGALFETSVLAPVKLKGFLRVSPGDTVTVLDAVGGPSGMAFVQRGDEVGKVPVSSLCIDQHCCNVYLAACIKILLHSRALLHLACARESSLEHLVDILSTQPGALTQALTTLISLEVEEKKARQLEMETLRADSPAIRLLAAVLQRPAIVALQHDLIIGAVAAITVAVEIGENPTSDVCVGPFLHQLVAMIKGILDSPAPELVAVLRALQRGNAGHLALSFLCLRCFAPSLARASLPGSDVPEAVQAHLRGAAKALQLVANDVEPKEDSRLYPLRAVLKGYSSILEQATLNASLKSDTVHRPTKSLLDSSMRLYTMLYKAHEWFQEETTHDPLSDIDLGGENVHGTDALPKKCGLSSISSESHDMYKKSLVLWSTGPAPSEEELAKGFTEAVSRLRDRIAEYLL